MRRPDAPPVDPEVVRELDALDSALAGRPTEPELVELTRLVQAERPMPPPGAFRELDERVAAQFPRRRARHLPGWLPSLRFTPALAGACSLLLVAVVGLVAVSVHRSSPGGGTGAVDHGIVGPRSAAQESAPATGGSGAAAPVPAPTAVPPTGPEPALGERRRQVERSAAMTLGARSDAVEQVARQIVGIVSANRGIVVTQSVSTGDGDQGGAAFELRIPSARLETVLDAVAQLEGVHVQARNETGTDITGAFVSARRRLADRLEERRALLRALARAQTANAADALRARLRIVRGEIAQAEGAVRSVRRRTDLARAAITVATTGATGEGGRGSWTPSDALHDALRILSVALSVLLVSLAVLLPLATLGGLGWAAARSVRRRARAQALDAT